MPTKCEEIDDARWDEQFGIALDAAYYLAQAAFAPLRAGGRGRFVIMSSAQALHGGAMNPVYAAVKSAQRGMAKALAREWGPHGITVNWVAAAPRALSPLFEGLPLPLKPDPVMVALGQGPALDEGIAGVIDFLGSAAGMAMTGATVMVDGGEWMVP